MFQLTSIRLLSLGFVCATIYSFDRTFFSSASKVSKISNIDVIGNVFERQSPKTTVNIPVHVHGRISLLDGKGIMGPTSSFSPDQNEASSTEAKPTTTSVTRPTKRQPVVTSAQGFPLQNVTCNISGKKEVLFVTYKYRTVLSIVWFKNDEYFRVISQKMKFINKISFRIQRPEKVLFVSFVPADASEHQFKCRTLSVKRRKRMIGRLRLIRNEVQVNQTIVFHCYATDVNHIFTYAKLCGSISKTCSSIIYRPRRVSSRRSVFLIRAKKDMHGMFPRCCMNETHSNFKDRCVNSTKEIYINKKVHNLSVFPKKSEYNKDDTVLCTAEGYPSPETSWNVNQTTKIQRDTLSDSLKLTKAGTHRYTCVARNAFGTKLNRLEKTFLFIVIDTDAAKITDMRQTIAFALCGLLLTAFIVSFLIILIRKTFFVKGEVSNESLF